MAQQRRGHAITRFAGGGAHRKPPVVYAQMAKVSISDTYYTVSTTSQDFSAVPTPQTASIMRDLGMLFREETDGFSILYDTRRKPDLFRYLQREITEYGAWTRLSFTLILTNPFFGNFTQVPIHLDPARENFYFSNASAHVRHDQTILNPRRYVTGRELVSTVFSQMPVAVGREVHEVLLRDISRAVVLCLPRCVPASFAGHVPPNSITCADVREYFAGKPPSAGQREQWVCRNTLYVDFASLREDLYAVQFVDRRGQVLRQPSFLNTEPMRYAFINLLFSEPAPGHGGIYPVQGLDSTEPRVVPVQYHLCFRRRLTYWRYYVVLRREAAALTIATEPPGSVTFDGPFRTIVGSATPASLFISTSPVPLSESPPARFILKSGEETLMSSMPVPSVQQVLPVADSPPDGNPPRFIPGFREYSDVYVTV